MPRKDNLNHIPTDEERDWVNVPNLEKIEELRKKAESAASDYEDEVAEEYFYYYLRGLITFDQFLYLGRRVATDGHYVSNFYDRGMELLKKLG